MKKAISFITIAVIIFASLAGCGSSANAGTSTESATPPDPSALSGSISTNGSTSMEKVIASLIEAFTAENPGVTITYDATGSGSGITAASEGSADIGLSSRA